MTCKYNYELVNHRSVGEYQCEVEDFRRLWKYIRRNVLRCVVKLSNGDIWVYRRRSRYASSGSWEKV